jgi:hypothetical protein
MDLRRRSKNRVVEAMAGGADLAIRQESAAAGPIDMTTLTPWPIHPPALAWRPKRT